MKRRDGECTRNRELQASFKAQLTGYNVFSFILHIYDDSYLYTALCFEFNHVLRLIKALPNLHKKKTVLTNKKVFFFFINLSRCVFVSNQSPSISPWYFVWRLSALLCFLRLDAYTDSRRLSASVWVYFEARLLSLSFPWKMESRAMNLLTMRLSAKSRCFTLTFIHGPIISNSILLLLMNAVVSGFNNIYYYIYIYLCWYVQKPTYPHISRSEISAYPLPEKL